MNAQQEEILAHLNEEQKQVVVSDAHKMLILAGAGSGKTRTLIHRVAWLLSTGVEPKNILLLTFTNKAANEMLNRVEVLTGTERAHFWGGTFHHICQKIIRRHADKVGLTSSFGILDENDSNTLFFGCVRDINPEFLKNKDNPKPNTIREILSYARNTVTKIDTVIAKSFPYFDKIKGEISEFYHEYQKRKLAENQMDYDDLLEMLHKLLLENPEILSVYKNQFKHVLVDEYQDTNQLQNNIVDLISEGNSLLVVGDDAQSIYSWRGANFENILNFNIRHRDAKIFKIETNYRSRPEILEFANAIPVAEKKEFVKHLKAVREPLGVLPFVAFPYNTRQQAKFVAKRIIGLQSEGYKFSDIAVLYRAHFHSIDLQMELSRNAIPYSITSGVRFFEQLHIKDILGMLRFALNQSDSTAFIKTVCRLQKVGDKTAEKIFSYLHEYALTKNKHIVDFITEEHVMLKFPVDARVFWEQMALTLQQMMQGISIDKVKQTEDLFEYVQLLEQSTDVEKFQKKSCNELIKIAIDGEYEEYLRRTYANWSARTDDIYGLMDFSNKFSDVSEFLGQIALMQSDDMRSKADNQQNCVSMTTIHQSKGLEFKIVFVIGLVDNQFPLKRAIEEETVNEERRLFYVATTRARDELYMCCPATSDSSANGFVVPLKPSRFLSEVPKFLYEKLKLINF